MVRGIALSAGVVAQRKQLLVREAISLLAIGFVALLLQTGGHQVSVLVLDSFLIFAGLIGILTAFLMGSPRYRWWFVGLSTIAVTVGALQLFLSSGLALGFLILAASLPVGDAIINILLLGRHAWLNLP